MTSLQCSRRLAALVLVAGMMLSSTSSADPDPKPSPEHMRTKTEWVAIRGGGSGFGVAASLHLFTLRWDHVYWDIVRASLIGGMIGAGIMEGGQGGDGVIWGGTAVGYPWHLGGLGRHEIRIGVAGGAGVGSTNALFLDGGFEKGTYAGDDCDNEDCTVPLVLWVVFGPDLYYVWHFDEHFAFLAGVEFWYGPAIGESEGGAFVGTFFGAAI